MSIFKNGIKVSGQVEVGGTTGTSSDVITGGDTPGFTTPEAYFKETFPHIPPLGQRSRAPKKLLVLGLGNSNWLGQAAEAGQPDRDGLYRPEAGLYEVSQGRDHGAFYAAAEGELMQLRVPNQDNYRFEINEVLDDTPTIDPLENSGVLESLGKAGPKMAAMKRAKALLPEIEEIAILTCAIGGSGLARINLDSGFRNVADWLDPSHPDATGNDGQALVDLKDKANAFLAAHPDYECGWIAGQLGPIACYADMLATEFREKLLDTIAYLRTNVTGASQAVFTMHSMHPNLIDTNSSVGGGVGGGDWQSIEDEILAFADKDPLLRTGIIDASPFTATADGSHHTDEEFNEIGRLHGEAYVAVRMGLENAAALPECRFLPNEKGSLECVLGSGFRIHDQVTEKDPIMGTVLRAAPAGVNQPAGFQTDVRLNKQAHTIFARVRFMQDPTGERPLFSGVTPGQTGIGRLMTIGTAEYEGNTGGALDPLLETGSAKALTQYLWHSVAFVFDGSDIKAFRDGVLTATGVGAGAVISQETILELMDYGNGGDGTTAETDARMTDIRVAPRALSDAEVLAWHEGQPDVVDGGTEKLVDTNNGGAAIALPLNPAAGEGWEYQRSSGTYLATFQRAANGDGMLSSEAGLPWDPNNDGNGNPTATVAWLIEIRTLNTASAFVTARSYGIDSSPALRVRSWTNFLAVDPATGAWTPAAAWEELTDGTFS